MKYINKTKSGTGADVYNFFMGKEEIEIVCALLNLSKKNTPRTTDTAIYLSRIRTLSNQFGELSSKK